MRNKIILLVALIIIVIGVWLYLFFIPSQHTEETIPEEKAAAPAIPLPEPWDFRAEGYVMLGIENSTYHIISGQLMPEQVEKLAEIVIEDILNEAPGLEEITLFFYSELVDTGINEPDIARIDWTAGEMNIEIK